MRTKPVPITVERALQRRRTGLVEPDVDEAPARRDRQIGRDGWRDFYFRLSIAT
jgi:hypothetical protein